MGKGKGKRARRHRRLNLGQLVASSLTARDQAAILARLRDTLRSEDVKMRERRRDIRRKQRQSTGVVRTGQAKRARTTRLLAILNTTTDPEQIRAARRELDAHVEDPAERSPSAATQHREGRTAAIVAHHQPGRAPYWAKIGPAPHCQPGDTATAMGFLRRVQRALDDGGWTHNERAALLMLAAKWQPRAYGTDARFMLVGTLAGRLPKALEEKIRSMRVKQP